MNKLSHKSEAGMTLIVKTITRLTVSLILIYGIYIVMRGHISPGGGFAGGVIIALSFIHLMLAFGKGAVLEKINEARGVAIAGLCGIILVGIAGAGLFGVQYAFVPKSHDSLFGAGLIPWYDLVISVAVAVELFVIFLALVLFTAQKQKE